MDGNTRVRTKKLKYLFFAAATISIYIYMRVRVCVWVRPYLTQYIRAYTSTRVCFFFTHETFTHIAPSRSISCYFQEWLPFSGDLHMQIQVNRYLQRSLKYFKRINQFENNSAELKSFSKRLLKWLTAKALLDWIAIRNGFLAYHCEHESEIEIELSPSMLWNLALA